MRRWRGYKLARGIILGILLICTACPRGWAWGREGHRLTALVAEQYLTPEAKAEVTRLLSADSKGRETLADVAPWADAYRESHPETASWHFVDIPASEDKYNRNRDCPLPVADPKSPWRDCVTDRILYFEGILGDTSLSLKDRAMALKFLVHLIGDVHQPFHTWGDDRGGNNVSVVFLGSAQCESYHCNLHGVWDDAFIAERGLSEAKYLSLLQTEIVDNNWQRLAGGDPSTWANLSHQYARNAVVPNGAMLRRDYYDDEIKVVDSQLALGGLRLAHVLNRIFKVDDAVGTPSSTPAGATKP